jgi:hypothetical protein
MLQRFVLPLQRGVTWKNLSIFLLLIVSRPIATKKYRWKITRTALLAKKNLDYVKTVIFPEILWLPEACSRGIIHPWVAPFSSVSFFLQQSCCVVLCALRTHIIPSCWRVGWLGWSASKTHWSGRHVCAALDQAALLRVYTSLREQYHNLGQIPVLHLSPCQGATMLRGKSSRMLKNVSLSTQGENAGKVFSPNRVISV